MRKKNGRPPGVRPLFNNAEDMQVAIDSYFDWADWAGWPYTVPDLTFHLGFSARQCLWKYKQKEEFVDTVKSALQRIEGQRNRQLITDGNAAGKIFDLKNNFGWIDQTEVKHEVKQLLIAIPDQSKKQVSGSVDVDSEDMTDE